MSFPDEFSCFSTVLKTHNNCVSVAVASEAVIGKGFPGRSAKASTDAAQRESIEH